MDLRATTRGANVKTERDKARNEVHVGCIECACVTIVCVIITNNKKREYEGHVTCLAARTT